MRVDPVTDAFAFLTKPSYLEPAWLHYGYWLLTIVSLSIASAAWHVLAGQARPKHLARFAVRFLLATFWWQQSLWACPTDTSALRYWTDRQIQHAAYPPQGMFVKLVILPVFEPFAYGLYAFEVAVAVALALGLFVRALSASGALLIFTVFLGLYRAPQEWPWDDLCLAVLMAVVALENYGHSLGLDAYREARSPAGRRRDAAAVVD
jgi:hypothetical protein